MTAKNYGGGTAIYILGSVIEGVVGMVFTMALVRLITQDDFGAWRQFAVLAAIVWNIGTYGLSRSLSYFFSTAPAEQQGAIARRTLVLTICLAAVAVVLFYFGLPFAAKRFDSPALADEAFHFSLYLGLVFPIQVVMTLLLAAGRRRLLAGVKLCMSCLRMAALLPLLWFHATLHIFMMAMIAFALIQFLVLLVIYLRTAGPLLSPVWQDFSPQLRYTLDLTGQSIASPIAQEADKIIVSSAYSPARFAAYSVGARELPLIPLIPFSITDSIAPDLSRLAVAGRMEDFRDFWHRWIKRAALLMYPVFALVLFMSEEIVTVLFTREYLEGALPLLIVGCLIPLRVSSFSQVLLCLNASRLVMWVSFAGLAFTIALSLLFIRLFGIWGPALAILVTEYVLNLFVITRIAKLCGFTLSRVVPWSYLLKLLLLAVLSGALALPVLNVVPESGAFLSLLAFGITLLVLYGAAVLSLRMVDGDDLAILRAWFRR